MSWAAFLASVGKALAAGLQWLLNRQQIEAGRAIERTAEAAAAAKAREAADEADRRVDAAGRTELDELRARWTRK